MFMKKLSQYRVQRSALLESAVVSCVKPGTLICNLDPETDHVKYKLMAFKQLCKTCMSRIICILAFLLLLLYSQ